MIQLLNFGFIAMFDFVNISTIWILIYTNRNNIKNRKTLLLMDKSNIEHNASMFDISFANISRPTRCQALKFDHIAIFSLSKRSNDFDLTFEVHKF